MTKPIIKWDRPCYKCRLHFCDASCKEPEQESDDLTAAYLSGVYDGKNKYAPQSFTYEQVKAHIQAALMSSSMPQLQTFTGENPFPPQREWVGLTDEEYKIIRYGSDDSGERYVSEIESYVDDCAKAIEAKLREKNGC